MAQIKTLIYYNNSKQRHIVVITDKDGKRKQIGSAKDRQIAENTLNNYLNLHYTMPPKPKGRVRKLTLKYELKDALAFLQTLNYNQKTIDLSMRNLTALILHTLKNQEDTSLINRELQSKYANYDLLTLLKDYDGVVEIVSSIISSRTNEVIAIDTQKQYYFAINLLFTQAPNNLVLTKELEDKYVAKVREINELSNKKRRSNKPKAGNALHPDLTWEVMRKEYEDYLRDTPMTNTQSGRHALRVACLIGLYVLQRPRRSKDYATLQYYTSLPDEDEMNGKNILLLTKDKATLYIDDFKNRYITRKNVKKEIMGRYIKDLNPRLAELFRDYIKKANIRDMSKRTTSEKRAHKQFYIFHLETGTQDQLYTDNGISAIVATAMKEVYKRNGLQINSFRHAFNDYLVENLKEFNDNQLAQVAEDVGDTWKDMPTNIRYRLSNQNNEDMTPTEIQDNLNYRDEGRMMYEYNANDGASNEVVSPEEGEAEVVSLPSPLQVEGIDELYRKIGQKTMELELLKVECLSRLQK
jgi:hypothetical protein